MTLYILDGCWLKLLPRAGQQIVSEQHATASARAQLALTHPQITFAFANCFEGLFALISSEGRTVRKAASKLQDHHTQSVLPLKALNILELTSSGMAAYGGHGNFWLVLRILQAQEFLQVEPLRTVWLGFSRASSSTLEGNISKAESDVTQAGWI